MQPLILASANWGLWVLIAVAGVLLATWASYTKRLRAALSAAVRGNVAESLGGALSLAQGRSLPALMGRLVRPGAAELHVAGLHWEAGRPKESISWAARCLRVARSPQRRWSAHAIAARACAELGDVAGSEQHLAELRQGRRVAPPLGFEYHSAAIHAALALGRIDWAISRLREAVAVHPHAVPLELAGLASMTLASAGEFDSVFQLTEVVLSRLQGGERSVAVLDAMAADPSLKRANLAVIEARQLGCLEAAMEAAENAQRWDLYKRYLEVVETAAPTDLRLQSLVLMNRAFWAARCGKRDAAMEELRSVEQLVSQQPRDARLQRSAGITRIKVCQYLGEHEQALATMRTLAESPTMSPMGAAELAHGAAKSLAALGRNTEAAAKREEAARLAPGAFWSKDAGQAPQGASAEDLIGPWIRPTESGPPQFEASIISCSPVAPVASGLAFAIWILSVAAMVPIIGSLPATALAALSIVLLAERRPLRHDRRVAWAGLAFAVLSIGTTIAWAANLELHSRSHDAPKLYSPTEQSLEETADDGDEPDGAAEGDDDEGEADHDSAVDDGSASDALDAPTDEQSKSIGLNISWPQTALILAVLIVSVMLHEIGHAVAAFWSGDPTARDQGRFSLNPLRHLSLLGSFLVPMFLALMPGNGIIGWAKPVPIMPQRFRHQRRGSLAVSLAGVSLNFLLALIAADAMIVMLIALSRLYPQAIIGGLVHPFIAPWMVGVEHSTVWAAAFSVCKTAVWLNAFLAFFNLLPIPPLDGFGVLRSLLPARLGQALGKLSGVGMILLLAMLALNLLHYLLLPGVLLGLMLLTFVGILGGQ